MADLFKDRYNYDAIHRLATEIKAVYDKFPTDKFLKATMDDTWNELEFKQRFLHISETLGKYLPPDYEEAIHIIDKVIVQYSIGMDGLVFFFPAFVERYGQDEENWELSMAALARYTPYASSEFAVRAFIIKDEKRMMEQMYIWAGDDNEHVRRLASEGCRPQLPWGQALVAFKKDPAPILPILERLKTDPSSYVRKSVANNLNDISKTHPDLVAALARKWYGENDYTDWIIRHGCRTLLKKGNRDMLALFGYDDVTSVRIQDLKIAQAAVLIGEDVHFSFVVVADKEVKVRIEYGIDYVKANGKRNRKLFKITEISLKENEQRVYTKKHSFRDLSTRKHYPGTHSITLIVNGAERGNVDFELLDKLS